MRNETAHINFAGSFNLVAGKSLPQQNTISRRSQFSNDYIISRDQVLSSTLVAAAHDDETEPLANFYKIPGCRRGERRSDKEEHPINATQISPPDPLRNIIPSRATNKAQVGNTSMYG